MSTELPANLKAAYKAMKETSMKETSMKVAPDDSPLAIAFVVWDSETKLFAWTSNLEDKALPSLLDTWRDQILQENNPN